MTAPDLTIEGEPAPSRPPRRSPGYDALWIPVLGFCAVLFVLPVIQVIRYSVLAESGEGVTWQWFTKIFSQPAYLQILGTTFWIALVVTALCLVLAYPLSYFLSRLRSGALLTGLMLLVLVPFLTSILVKSYSWLVLLGQYGIVNSALVGLGVPGAPFSLLYNEFGLVVGMTNSLLPFMVLSLTSVMRGIDSSVMLAGASLGASPVQRFRRVLLPLSLPGIGAGCVLTFIVAAGSFVVPALLGGPRQTMIGQIIEQAVQVTLDYRFASALSVVLLVCTVSIYVVGMKAFGRDALVPSTRV